MSTDQRLIGMNSLSDLVKHPSLSTFLDLSVDSLELNETLDLILSKIVHIENDLLHNSNQSDLKERAKLIENVSRLALFNASANGLADNVDDNWLPILVKDGLCTPELALCLTPRMKHDPFIGDMLRELAPLLAKSEKLIKQAIEIADKMPEMYWRYVALSALVPYLPDPEERIDDVLNITPGFESEIGQVKILTTLLPHLPPKKFKTTLKLALKALQQIRGYDHIVRAIMRLLPWLPRASSELQLQTLWKLVDEEFPELSPLLTQNMIVIPNRMTLRRYFAVMAWFGILNGLESQLLSLEEYLYLDTLVPYLPQNLRQACIDEALRLLHEVKSPYHKACGLAQLAPNLPRNQSATVLSEALRAARKTDRKEPRALALIRVSRCMEPVEQAQLIEEALPLLGNPNSGSSALALAELLSLFSLEDAKKYLTQILSSLTQLDDLPSRFVTAVLLNPEQIHREDRNELFEKLVKRWYRQARYTTPLELVKLFPYLSSEERAPLIEDLLVETNRLSNEHARSYAWRHILPFIPLDKREFFLNRLVETALSIKVTSDDFLFGGVVERSQELSSLVGLVPKSKRGIIIQEAVSAMFRMYATWSRKGGFRLMYGSDYFSEFVEDLLPALSEEQAIDLIRSATPHLLIGDRWRLAALLYPRLAPKDALPTYEWLISQMLEPSPTEELHIIYSMIRTCTHLAYLLTGERRASIVNRALSLTDKIESILYRVRSLLYLTPHLEGDPQQQILQQAFEGIEIMPFQQQKDELLRIAKHVTGLPDELEMWACIRTLRLGSHLERRELLSVLEAFGPRLRALGGVEATSGVAEALNEIGTFFE